MKKLAIVLLSGGLDSTTVAAQAVREGYELSAITVHYGQLHSKELQAARNIAAELALAHQVVDLSFYRELAWYSALTNPEDFEIPENRETDEMSSDIPITYVPLRNTFFLTLAAAYLESQALHFLESEGGAPSELEVTLLIAANAIDYSGYPDCRPEYYETLISTLHLGSKLGTQYGVSFQVRTPLIKMTKAEIVRFANEIRAPIELTWSCYLGGDRPCGQCDSCLLREKGFAEADIPDPAL